MCLLLFGVVISTTPHATSPVQWMWDPPHTQKQAQRVACEAPIPIWGWGGVVVVPHTITPAHAGLPPKMTIPNNFKTARYVMLVCLRLFGVGISVTLHATSPCSTCRARLQKSPKPPKRMKRYYSLGPDLLDMPREAPKVTKTSKKDDTLL